MARAAILAVFCARAALAAPTVEHFDSPRAALERALAGRPRVVAFGEYHELEGAPKVRSAIVRFKDELLPAVSASDLVVETWITDGKCGAAETEAVARVDADTQRPASTESEIVQLMRTAKAAGVQPHVLTLSCDEYAALQPKDGQLDYVTLLDTITRHLAKEIAALLPKRAVAVYGGALHNDLYPRREFRRFSFAPALARKLGSAYREVDLYVPEWVERDPKITAEPWWKKVAPDRTTLVRRGPGSFIIVFPRQR